MVKNFFLISNLNLPSFSLQPFPLVPSLHTLVVVLVVAHLVDGQQKAAKIGLSGMGEGSRALWFLLSNSTSLENFALW